VPGDIVVLHAGTSFPATGLVEESKDLFVDEAMLTGETFPAEKAEAVLRRKRRSAAGQTRSGWAPTW